jgi:Formaldehyde-activating enzyme (Fae)
MRAASTSFWAACCSPGIDDLGAALALGLGLAGDSADHALVKVDALQFRASQISPFTLTRPSPPCQDTISPSAPMSASLPVTTGRSRERNSAASTRSSSAALPIAAPAITPPESVNPGARAGNIISARCKCSAQLNMPSRRQRGRGIPRDQADDLFICVGVFIHWDAVDNKKIQDYNYRATKGAIARAIGGDPKAAEVIAKRNLVIRLLLKNQGRPIFQNA